MTENISDIPNPAPRGVKSLLEAHEGELASSIKSRFFTPIIGAESSIIGRESTKSWQLMSDDMTRFLSCLRETATGNEVDYFESLMREKCVEQMTVTDPVAVPDELDHLRRALAGLASKAIAIFAKEMVGSAVSDVADYKVEVTGKRDFATLNNLLIRASLAALELTKKKSDQEEDGVPRNLESLDGIHVYKRLLDLTYKFMGGHIPSMAEEPLRAITNKDHAQELRQDLLSQSMTEVREHQLFLHQLEWLSDLMFHTFSFDGQFYPTNDELSFRAALRIAKSDQRPPSVNVFEKGWDSLVDVIPVWFQQYGRDAASSSRQMQDFYHAVALSLKKQDKCCRGKHETRGKDPVVFSLNLDLEMEKAIQWSRVIRYYVAIPVRAETASANSLEMQIHQRWLLAEFSRGEDEIYKGPTWKWYSDDMAMGGGLDGPLVIKLHGSPLHPLPKPHSGAESKKGEKEKDSSTQYIAPPPDGVVYSSLKHFVTLSESGYLNDIVIIGNLPEFFERVFGDTERRFYFLGLPTSEWNIHLRIADLIFTRRPGRTWPPGRKMVAINRKFDDYSSSILDSLGIDRWEGLLEGYTSSLLESLEKEPQQM